MNKNILKIAVVLSIIVGVIECIFVYFIPVGIITFIGASKINKYSKMRDASF